MRNSGGRPKIPSQYKRDLLFECGRCCSVCGYSQALEFAHIIPWHKKKSHSPDDLIVLCALCHARADKEKWGEKALRQYKANPWASRQKSRVEPPMESFEISIRVKGSPGSSRMRALVRDVLGPRQDDEE